MNQEVWNLVKTIAESARDNEQMAKSILGKVIVDQAVKIYDQYNDMQDSREVCLHQGYYVVDRNDPEDEKWEGLKEMEVFKDIGHSILRFGQFQKTKENLGQGRERFDYKVLVINQKEV